MSDIGVADSVQVIAPSSLGLISVNAAYNQAPSTVEFDVDYALGAEFVIRIGSPATVRLIFKDQSGAIIPGPAAGGAAINESPATFIATLSADGQSVLIDPKTLGSTILRYVYCRCLTANMIVRVTNRVGPLRPHRSVCMSVLDYLQVMDGDWQPRTIDDIISYVQADRQSIEGALEKLLRDGFVRQSGEFWLPLNPASAFSSAESRC